MLLPERPRIFLWILLNGNSHDRDVLPLNFKLLKDFRWIVFPATRTEFWSLDKWALKTTSSVFVGPRHAGEPSISQTMSRTIGLTCTCRSFWQIAPVFSSIIPSTIKNSRHVHHHVGHMFLENWYDLLLLPSQIDQEGESFIHTAFDPLEFVILLGP